MRYELIIYWSKEDNAFLVEVPELPGSLAGGESYEKAIRLNSSSFLIAAHTALFTSSSPFSLPSGLAQRQSQEPPAKSKFLAGSKCMAITVLLAAMLPEADGQTLLKVDATKSCNFHGGLVPDKPVYGFASDREAENSVKRILSYSGLEPNFKITAANVPNAAAVLDDSGETRLILYNQDFMERIKGSARTDWAAISILAHEIGHHLQGHTLKPGGSRPPSELEADKYSGFVVGMLGGTLDDAQAVMRMIASDEGSATHPAKDARLAAITNGWKQAQELFKDGTMQRPAPPEGGGIPQPARPKEAPVAAQSRYTGNVGRLAASFVLRWNPDGTVGGTYHYPSRADRIVYRLLGNNHAEGELYLEEYTGSTVTARIRLRKSSTPSEIVWSGEMSNTDGRNFPMRMARPR